MITYRLANKEDLIQVAQIHKEQFPTHYLGQFNTSLLVKFYSYLLDEKNVFVVAEEDKRILGFVIGGEWKYIESKLNLFIKENVMSYVWQIAIHPQTWVKSVQKFIGLIHKPKHDYVLLDDTEKYTLLSIATAKQSQGKGVGSGIVDAFNEEMKKIGNRYFLSVQDTNENAIRFYKKKDFIVANEIPGELQMIKEL